jgi:SAM-dependent methyltransferase
VAYQSFGTEGGDSASSLKLEAIRLPEDLKGKRFLDLGCNEGFFCGEALRRGASRVVGIDLNPAVIRNAKLRFPECEFYQTSWNELPEGKFDIILFTSAIHYEPNPQQLCRKLRDVLNPNGILILECGVVESSSEMWVDVQRHDGSLRFPTRPLLTKRVLDAFAVRTIGPSVPQKGDPLDRHIFHCFPFRPIAMIIGGASLEGKTTLAAELATFGVTRVDHDHIIGLIAKNQFGNRKKIYQYVHEHYDITKIDRLIDDIRGSELGTALIKEICAFVPREVRVVALEGYAFKYDDLRLEAESELEARGFKVWHTRSAQN